MLGKREVFTGLEHGGRWAGPAHCAGVPVCVCMRGGWTHGDRWLLLPLSGWLGLPYFSGRIDVEETEAQAGRQ